MPINSGLMSSKRGDWKTPKWLMEKLKVGTERFDVSDRHGGTFDAFSSPWPYKWYCNPPYGKEIAAWIDLMCETGRHGGIALLPARTDTIWFHKLILHADIQFIKGRLCFDESNPAPFPSMLALFPRVNPVLLSLDSKEAKRT